MGLPLTWNIREILEAEEKKRWFVPSFRSVNTYLNQMEKTIARRIQGKEKSWMALTYKIRKGKICYEVSPLFVEEASLCSLSKLANGSQ